MYVSMFERGYTAIGREKGRVEGRVEERSEIVKNMLSEGFSVNDILKCTRMSREELNILMGTDVI